MDGTMNIEFKEIAILPHTAGDRVGHGLTSAYSYVCPWMNVYVPECIGIVNAWYDWLDYLLNQTAIFQPGIWLTQELLRALLFLLSI